MPKQNRKLVVNVPADALAPLGARTSTGTLTEVDMIHFKDSLTVGDFEYRKTSNISCTLIGNRIVDNSDVVGASPVGAAPTTSSFST